MPLLVRKRQNGHAERRAEHPGLRFAREEAGHVRTLYGARPRADTDCFKACVRADIRKQPVGKLRQAFYMGEQRIALAQSERALLHIEQARDTVPSKDATEVV